MSAPWEHQLAPQAEAAASASRQAPLLFASADLDATGEVLTRYLEPGSVQVVTGRLGFGGCRLSSVFEPQNAVPELSLVGFRVDAEMDLHAVQDADGYTVCIRYVGRHDVTMDGKPVLSAHSLSSPGQNMHVRFCDSRVLAMRINRAAMDRAIGVRLEDVPSHGPKLDPTLHQERPEVAGWLRLVTTLADRSSTALLERSPLAAAHIQQVLVHGLLDIQAHTFESPRRHDAGQLGSRAIRRAVVFCEENAGVPISVADIATAAHTGIRSLQRAFRVEFGMGPMEYVRRVRLQRVRDNLMRIRAGTAAGAVTDVALAWGFTHLGRFSQLYREAYGECPSATLGR